MAQRYGGAAVLRPDRLSRMRIVHSVTSGEAAGGQVVALQLARAARAAGHDCVFVSPDDGPFLAQARAEGFATQLLRLDRLFRLDGVARLAWLLRREKADVLHLHTPLVATILGRLAGFVARVPVVSHVHIENHFPARPAQAALYRRLDNATARRCAALITVSRGTRDALEAQGYPPGRTVVIHNGVAPATAEPAALDIPRPVVGEIARLAEVKGQRTLLRACADLDVSVVLVGTDLEQGGAYRALLEREADELGMRARVLFTGYRADAAALLRSFDVFALPSTTEGLPLVLLEAMAAGVPVVATPVGGVPELVEDGVTGLLVPPEDPAALAAALRTLLDDAETARLLAAAARRRVEAEFSERVMGECVLAVYEDLRR
jgi:glycosyltransferase involved in cell wall biosynthesis